MCLRKATNAGISRHRRRSGGEAKPRSELDVFVEFTPDCYPLNLVLLKAQ